MGGGNKRLATAPAAAPAPQRDSSRDAAGADAAGAAAAQGARPQRGSSSGHASLEDLDDHTLLAVSSTGGGAGAARSGSRHSPRRSGPRSTLTTRHPPLSRAARRPSDHGARRLPRALRARARLAPPARARGAPSVHARVRRRRGHLARRCRARAAGRCARGRRESCCCRLECANRTQCVYAARPGLLLSTALPLSTCTHYTHYTHTLHTQ